MMRSGQCWALSLAKFLSHPPNPGNRGHRGERDARMTFACGTFLPETSPFTRNRLRDLLPDVDHQLCRDGHSMCDSPCFEKEKERCTFDL